MRKVEQCTVSCSFLHKKIPLDPLPQGPDHTVRVYFVTIHCTLPQWFSADFGLKPRHYIQNDLACKNTIIV